MLNQARNQLGTPGGTKSFPRGAQIFSTMSNTFFQGGTNFRACIYLSTSEKLFKTDQAENAIFYCLALTRIESKVSLYAMGCTACKQTY